MASGLSGTQPEVSISKTQLFPASNKISQSYDSWKCVMAHESETFELEPKQIWAVHVKVSSEIE